MKPVIIHISSDYPDPMQSRKTKAILNLVEGTPEFRHVVYSLNRYTAFGGMAALPFGADRIALAYGALPKGIFWEARLRDVADWIIADLKSKGIVPHLVEGHKFTVEGLVAQQVAQAFSCPFICDIQGNSDVRILKNKPSLRGRYRQMAKEVALVFPFAPWAVAPFEDLIGLDRNKVSVLPVVPEIEGVSAAVPVENNRLLSVFNLDLWELKNLKGLVRALALIAPDFPDVSLDICGAGAAESVAKVSNILARFDPTGRVNLLGPIPNQTLPLLIKNYAAFAMPTLRETYGLVFAEALFSGVPVLYSKGRSIDGYFNPQDIGYACDPDSVADIAAGLRHLLTHEADLKQGIARLQRDGGLQKLQKPYILSTYRQGIERVLVK
ncbi:MAG: glycosyltransferase family 4 protein [Alphaproteobacteria bacterium]|nr:glycosyltransferase family 4 protein [Alphaproteobacteria bacterium]